MRKGTAKRLAMLWIGAIIVICAVLPWAALAEDGAHRVLRVGWYESGDGADPAEATGAHGYEYEYLQAVAQYTGWTYDYVDGTWDDCLKRLETGEIDLLGYVSKTEERSNVYAFSQLPMAVTNAWLVVGEHSALREADAAALQGAAVGVVKGNAYNESLDVYCQQIGCTVNQVEYAAFADISRALEKGEIDAAVVSDEDITATEYGLVRLASSSQYYATAIGNEALLRELDDAMAQVSVYLPNLSAELYQKHFCLNVYNKPVFTAAEQAFVREHPTILVEYDSGWPPIEYMDAETGEYAGVSPSLFKLLSEKCGIDFVYKGSDSGQVLADLKSESNENVLTTISYDYAWAAQHNVYITPPFITSSIVKLGRNLDKASPTVAVNEKAYFTYLLADELQGVATMHFSKQAERLDAVLAGVADYTFVTEDQANYYRSIPKYRDLQVERMGNYEQGICISLSKNSDPALMTILSKGLASITHDEMTAILTSNTVNTYKYTFADRLFESRWTIITVAVIALALLVVAGSKMRMDRTKRLASDQANRAKSEFLSHVSHDIRTPLNAIIGITALAIEEKDVALKQDYLVKINESGKYLLGLINDTLDMSKIESGKLSLHYEAVNYQEIHEVIMTVVGPKAKEKEIQLSETLEGVGNEYVMTDKLRFEQILLNLLNNAIKFTPAYGSVHCGVKAARSDDQVLYQITISDTGVGMSEAFMKKLFTPFEQEHNRLSLENSGTGLGLSIVKSLVDKMGGTIVCSSHKNEGTDFMLELSCRLATPEEIAACQEVALPVDDGIFKGKRVLLAEDNGMNTMVARKMLEKKEMQVICAKNGKEALDMFLASERDGIDAVLMDIHMPEMNGLEASKAIRAAEQPDARTIPIIALSANAYDEDRRECLAAGMNDHVAKPIVPELLFAALKRAFQKRAKE